MNGLGWNDPPPLVSRPKAAAPVVSEASAGGRNPSLLASKIHLKIPRFHNPQIGLVKIHKLVVKTTI